MAESLDLTQLIYIIKDDKLTELRNSDGLRFIGHCLSHATVSTSQNYQDVFAAVANKFRPGFFVEFGATNGIDGSNTFMLEKVYGWTGLLAEPNPACIDELMKNRKADVSTKCVFVESGETLPFVVTSEPDLSTLSGYGNDDEHAAKRAQGTTIQVETITLYDLLEQYETPREIGYLSVDTEGSEYDILKRFFQQNDGKYTFNAVTVEHNFNDEKRNQIYSLMTANGYRRVFTEFSRWDDFYMRNA
jgi:FkbM family methyltransferase